MSTKRVVVPVTVIATLFAACGNGESDDNATVPSSVAAALEAEGEVLVSGHLFVLDDAIVVLAELAAESLPPQPGGTKPDGR